ncbi:MAG: hypothetical protein Q8K60_00400 [Parachlamydiaceae bacterium]|nr:hypothetical protein [Parachlamydiaceae bacterium]
MVIEADYNYNSAIHYPNADVEGYDAKSIPLDVNNNSFVKTKIQRSVHENTRLMINLVQEIIGEKKNQPVDNQGFFQSERSYNSYSHSRSHSKSWFSGPLIDNRSYKFGFGNNNNNNVRPRSVFESEEEKISKQEKADAEQRKTIGIVAGIALFPLTYVFGRLLGTRATINDQWDALINAKEDWESNKLKYPADYQSSIGIISNTSQSILNKRLRRNSFQLAWVVSVLGSCILAVAGALNKSNALVKTGVVSAGAVIGGSALYYLFTLGYNHGRPSKNNEVNSIKTILPFLEIQEENIELINDKRKA